MTIVMSFPPSCQLCVERGLFIRVEIKCCVFHITEPAGWCFYVHSSQLPVYFQIYLSKFLCLSPLKKTHFTITFLFFFLLKLFLPNILWTIQKNQTEWITLMITSISSKVKKIDDEANTNFKMLLSYTYNDI